MTTFDCNDLSIRDFERRKQLIRTIKNRFLTYGYNQIRTSTFEPYDLYSNVAGTIPQDEMVKVIDPSGKVLVLRPDVTIPITQEVAATYPNLDRSKRYFYVMDVFRQSFGDNGSKERTQAGVECFGRKSAVIDAEVIALAIHSLSDLGDYHFKIEIGHAGFFKQLAKHINLSNTDFEKLKQYIQAKNVTEIEPFLNRLNIDKETSMAIGQIPLLYGNPDVILEQAKKIALNDEMIEELNSIQAVYDVLKAYGIQDSVVLDLGLINHMDYYTDIIFQGFIENVARPVLMGGRYDHLAEQFNAHIPAIGFACDIEALLEATKSHDEPLPKEPIALSYSASKQSEALHLANDLRNDGELVLTFLLEADETLDYKQKIRLDHEGNRYSSNDKRIAFLTTDELRILLKEDA